VADAEAQALDERIVILAPTGRDAVLTSSLLSKAGLRPHVCSSMADLCKIAAEGAAVLIVAEEVLTPSALALFGATLSRQEPWSDLPVLLFTSQQATVQTRVPTPQLLAPLGNVILLDRPVRPNTMLSSVQSALRARRRQYEARAALEAERRAVRERDKFLAMLGHELRNPLAPILVGLELLERGGPESAAATRHRAVIRRQVQHLTRLVDDLLDVSRVTSGKIALQRSTVDLHELVGRCLESLARSIEAQRLTTSLVRAGQPLLIDGDSVRLEQVVTNLMVNAIKYTPPGGRIEISLAADEGSWAVLRFRDSGIGIAPDVLPRIFDLFVQAEQSLDRAKGGMGVGLTLVRRLVELHGGTVEATSPGLGQGSELTVRLPLQASAGASSQRVAPSEAIVAKAASSHRVLIIEDNPDSREMLQSFLELCGHHVIAAGDGITGVERALALRPDVLLVDIGLPGIDGYGVARRVREAMGTTVFLVALSGYGQPEDRRLAREAGFDLHFTKPVTVEAVEKLLSRRDLRQAS
jgi:signal transduction histidine kinase/CheY-like chemotaxis protein